VPKQELEFLGMLVNSKTMTMSLAQEKVDKIRAKCQSIVKLSEVTVRQVAEVIGTLSATAMAVLPAPLHYRHLQMTKTKGLMGAKSYEEKIFLTVASKEELRWWILHLQNANGKSIISPGPDMIMETDACLTGWGATCNGRNIQGQWNAEERLEPINALEMRAVFLALKGLLNNEKNRHIHIRSNNVTTVSHINKMGGTRSVRLVEITKLLWGHCLQNGLTITAEYLPGKNNVLADRLSRETTDSSDWKLDPVVFAELNKRFGPFTVDLFASRTNRQLQAYFSWKLDPDAQAIDAYLQPWGEHLGYAFPPFCMISRCLAKVRKDVAEMVIIMPTWNTQPWYASLLDMVCEKPILLPQSKSLLQSPAGENHPLIETKALTLAAWRISGNTNATKAFLDKQPNLLHTPGVQVPRLLTVAPGENGIAGVRNSSLIQFGPLW